MYVTNALCENHDHDRPETRNAVYLLRFFFALAAGLSAEGGELSIRRKIPSIDWAWSGTRCAAIVGPCAARGQALL